MQRYLALAFLAVVMGCADEGKKVAPAMPVQGDPVAADESSGSSEGSQGGGESESAFAEESGPADAPCAVNFSNDLMPKLVATCGSAACHLEANAPSVDGATPQITYESLLDFGFEDETWMDPHPNDSKLTEPALKAAVDGWRACGAPFE